MNLALLQVVHYKQQKIKNKKFDNKKKVFLSKIHPPQKSVQN